MQFLYDDNKPIIACSSGNTSNTGITLIRISGFQNFSIFASNLNINFRDLKFRYAYYSDLKFGSTIVDSIIATFFKGPKSFNGENILELSVHGNILNVNNIIENFITEKKFRLSAPGEFTYRAYKNNKLNLSQVEGLDLLLNANSNFALNQGLSLLDGALSSLYKNIYNSYLKHKSSVELSIDFSEDVGEEEALKQLNNSFSEFYSFFIKLKSRLTNESNLLSPSIVLLGEPNAGKSTLFNKLINSDRSIVSKIEGTTRDYITEKIFIKDVFYNLIDTAGVRDSSDEIEEIGVNRAIELSNNGFYNILLINLANPSFNLSKLNCHIDHIFITHCDLVENPKDLLYSLLQNSELLKLLSGSIGANANVGSIGAMLKTGSIGPDADGSMGADHNTGSIGPINLTFSFNREEQISNIDDFVSSKFNRLSSVETLLLERHKQILFPLAVMISQYKQLLSTESDISIISSELNNIGYLISELIGIVSPEDILQNIFTNFCIGK